MGDRISTPLTLSVACLLLTVGLTALPASAAAPIADFTISSPDDPITTQTTVTFTSTSQTCVDTGDCPGGEEEIRWENWTVTYVTDPTPDNHGPADDTVLRTESFGPDVAPGSSFSGVPFEDGTWEVTLEVTDEDDETDTISKTFDVVNVGPDADFNFHAPDDPDTAESTILTRSTSEDPDGDVVEEEWRVWLMEDDTPDANPPDDGPTLLHKEVRESGELFEQFDAGQYIDDDGFYRITLFVTDDDGDDTRHFVEFDVANLAPTGGFSISVDTGTPATVESTFTASSTLADSDGEITEEHWELWLIDDPTPDEDDPESFPSLIKQGTSDSGGSSFVFEVPDDGKYRVDLEGTDDDGAVVSLSKVITVSNTAPTVMMDLSATSDPISSIDDIAVDVDASDADGEIVEYIYNLRLLDDPTPDGEFDDAQQIFRITTTEASHTFSVPDDGEYQLFVGVLDDDGEKSVVDATFSVVNLAPDQPLLDIDPEDLAFHPDDPIHIKDLGPRGDRGDPDNQLESVVLHTPATGDIELQPGEHIVLDGYGVEACDEPVTLTYTDADGVSTTRTKEIDVDATLPTSAVGLPSTPSSGWYSGPVQVDVFSNDDCAGFSSATYTVDGASTTTQHHSFGFTVDGDGVHDVEVRATDRAGNVEDPVTRTVKIDTTDPEVEITSPCLTPLCEAGVEAGTVSNVIINADASDAGAGVDRVEFFIDGQLVGTDTDGSDGYATSWQASSGVHMVDVTAIDATGHSSTDSLLLVVT